jgi:hypothetical protein
MKRVAVALFCLLVLASCKKTKFSPEGPTDVRIKNLTDQTFYDVIYKTSENDEDVDTIAVLGAGQTSEYIRFKKAYPKLQISARINIGGTVSTYSNGTVSFTYMQYMGQDRLTYGIYVVSEVTKKLDMQVSVDEPLVLK